MYDDVLTLFKPWVPRYKVLRVSPELLLEGTLFNTRLSPDGTEVWATEVNPPLPEDCRVQAMAYNPMTNTVSLRLWSSEWEEVGPNVEPPLLAVTCTRRIYRLEGAVAKEQPPRGSLGVPATWTQEKLSDPHGFLAASVGFKPQEFATVDVKLEAPAHQPEELTAEEWEVLAEVNKVREEGKPRGGYF